MSRAERRLGTRFDLLDKLVALRGSTKPPKAKKHQNHTYIEATPPAPLSSASCQLQDAKPPGFRRTRTRATRELFFARRRVAYPRAAAGPREDRRAPRPPSTPELRLRAAHFLREGSRGAKATRAAGKPWCSRRAAARAASGASRIRRNWTRRFCSRAARAAKRGGRRVSRRGGGASMDRADRSGAAAATARIVRGRDAAATTPERARRAAVEER